ncbi:MAG: sporulation protein YqfD [Clostridiales bacterium]|nr:sporulation protein YqfD [Clostridiales bacterium]
MVEQLIKFLRGTVELRVSGDFVERFLNLAARGNLPIWDLVRSGENEVRLTTTPAAFRRMRKAAFRAGVRIQVLHKRGLPFRFKRIKGRTALLLGGLLFFVTLYTAGQLLWDISVEGCEELDPDVVLETLAELGLRKGAWIRKLDLTDIELGAQLALQRLSFIAVNIKGTTAEVQVQERVLPPESLEPTGVRNLVASRDGQIERMEVYEGMAVVRRGDTVRQGDLLVTGTIQNELSGMRYVAADARILARTWKSGAIVAPRIEVTRHLTGKQVLRHSLLLPGFSIKLYVNSGISMADYVTLVRENDIELPFGIRLPVGVRTEAHCEQVTLSRTRSDEELERMCLAKLDQVVAALRVEQLLSVEHELALDGEGARLSFELTCLEDIVQVVQLQP